MKWVLAAWGLLGSLLLVSAFGATPVDPASSPNVAVELQNQDAALSLLLEAFRQVQSSLIESDYDSEVRAASSLTEVEARRTVLFLADLERYLRSRKLGKQVGNLLTAYDYARKMDESGAGVTVPSMIDLRAAASKLKDFRLVTNDQSLHEFPPVINAGLETPVFTSDPPDTTQIALPDQLQKYMLLLSENYTNDHALVMAVDSLLRHGLRQTKSMILSPTLVTVSYRERDGHATDVVVQLFDHPKKQTESVVANPRLSESPLGPDVLGPADEWLNILNESQVSYLGPENEVFQRKRAFRLALQADMTLMQEQTVEPLHLIVVIPDPEQLLPRSLSHRVRAAIIDADLAFGEWHSQARFVTADTNAAEQVSFLLAGWRDLAMSVVDIHTDSDTSLLARHALEASTVEVKGNDVLVVGSAQSSLGIRVIAKLVRWSVEEAPVVDELRMVTICKNGRSMQIPACDLSASLAKGAHAGRCR